MKSGLYLFFLGIFLLPANVNGQKQKKVKKDDEVEIVFKVKEDVRQISQMQQGGFMLQTGRNLDSKKRPRLYHFNSNLESQWKVSLSEPSKYELFNCLVSSKLSPYVYHVWSESKLAGAAMEIAPFKVTQIDEKGAKQDLKCRIKEGKFDKEMPIAFFQNKDKLFFISIQWNEPTVFRSYATKDEKLKAIWKREVKLFSKGHDEKDFDEKKLEIPLSNYNIPVTANLTFLANNDSSFYLSRKEMYAQGQKVNQVVYHISNEGLLLDSLIIDIDIKGYILPTVNLKQSTGFYSFENGVIDLYNRLLLGHSVRALHSSGGFAGDYTGAAAIITHNAFGSTWLDLDNQVLWYYGLSVKPGVRWVTALTYNFFTVTSNNYSGIGVPYEQVVLLKYDFKTGTLLEEYYKDVQLSNGEKNEVLGSKAVTTTTLPQGLKFYGLELAVDTFSKPRLYVVGKKWFRSFDFNMPEKNPNTIAFESVNKYNPKDIKLDLENQLNYAFLNLLPSENNQKLNETMAAIGGDFRNRKRSVFCIRQGVNIYLFENSSFTKHPKLTITKFDRFKTK